MFTQKQLGKKIKKIREKRGLSQEELAKLIGISRAALSELERGNRNLGALELIKMINVLGLDINDFSKNKKQETTINPNQKIKFEPNKLRQLILYLLSKCGGKANFGETVLYKLLYFIDFDSHEILGEPITGMNYIHQKFGPIPQARQYQSIIQKMKDNKEIRTFNQDYHGMIQKRYVALKNYNISNFSIEEKEVIDKVINLLSDFSAKQIEDYSHGDIPWKSTKNNEVISYNLVIDRNPPYTKCNYEQEWQNKAVEDTIKVLGEISKDEQNYYKNL